MSCLHFIKFQHFNDKFQMTNQMILACKAYLTEDGKINIWDDSKYDMILKIKVNIYLKKF